MTAADDRLFVEAVLYRYCTGLLWRDLPERFGCCKNVHRRHSHWSAAGGWERLDLICIGGLGYVRRTSRFDVPLAETACELMFRVIADRAEKAAVILTTNLAFLNGLKSS